jgi:hypothetical protein
MAEVGAQCREGVEPDPSGGEYCDRDNRLPLRIARGSLDPLFPGLWGTDKRGARRQ